MSEWGQQNADIVICLSKPSMRSSCLQTFRLITCLALILNDRGKQNRGGAPQKGETLRDALLYYP